jgi:hypothetical protein
MSPPDFKHTLTGPPDTQLAILHSANQSPIVELTLSEKFHPSIRTELLTDYENFFTKVLGVEAKIEGNRISIHTDGKSPEAIVAFLARDLEAKMLAAPGESKKLLKEILAQEERTPGLAVATSMDAAIEKAKAALAGLKDVQHTTQKEGHNPASENIALAGNKRESGGPVPS